MVMVAVPSVTIGARCEIPVQPVSRVLSGALALPVNETLVGQAQLHDAVQVKSGPQTAQPVDEVVGSHFSPGSFTPLPHPSGGVEVTVGVGVTVWVAVTVGVAVFVAVGEAVAVRVGVAVAVALGVAVLVAVSVAVTVGTAVNVAVVVGTGVSVTVTTGLRVAVVTGV